MHDELVGEAPGEADQQIPGDSARHPVDCHRTGPQGLFQRDDYEDRQGSQLKSDLEKSALRVEFDERENMKPGAKYFEWEGLGVPVRLEIGPRDLASGQVVLARRTGGKAPVPLQSAVGAVTTALEEIQAALFTRARDFREAHTVRLDSLEALVKFFETSIGFVVTPWCGRLEDERTVKDRTTATTRVILGASGPAAQPCGICGRPATVEVAWGKAY